MKKAAEDLQHRRPVWEALSDLFLDTDTSLSREWRVEILAASPYSVEELQEILLKEVTPICRWNLVCIAGEWAGFDQEWLEKRILRRVQSSFRFFRFPRFRVSVMISDEWDQTKKAIHKMRLGQSDNKSA